MACFTLTELFARRKREESKLLHIEYGLCLLDNYLLGFSPNTINLLTLKVRRTDIDRTNLCSLALDVATLTGKSSKIT